MPTAIVDKTLPAPDAIGEGVIQQVRNMTVGTLRLNGIFRNGETQVILHTGQTLWYQSTGIELEVLGRTKPDVRDVTNSYPGLVAIVDSPTDTGGRLPIGYTGGYTGSISFAANHDVGNNQAIRGKALVTVDGNPNTTGTVIIERNWGIGRTSGDNIIDVNIPLSFVNDGTIVDVGDELELWVDNLGSGSLEVENIVLTSIGPL